MKAYAITCESSDCFEANHMAVVTAPSMGTALRDFISHFHSDEKPGEHNLAQHWSFGLQVFDKSWNVPHAN